MNNKPINNVLGKQLMEIYKGKDKSFSMKFVKEDDSPIDLTDNEIVITAKKKYAMDDEDALFQKTFTPSDPSNGIVEINFNWEETEDYERGNYYYDIQLNRDDKKIIIDEGILNIKLPVNKNG